MHEINPADAQRIDDRNLYAPLRHALNPEHEPWHLPHFHPEAAHAASEIEDLEPRRQRIPEGGGVVLAAVVVAALAALVLALL